MSGCTIDQLDYFPAHGLHHDMHGLSAFKFQMGQALISGSTINQKYLCNVWLPLLNIWEAEPEGPEPKF